MNVRTSSPAPRRAPADDVRVGDGQSSPTLRRAGDGSAPARRRSGPDWRKVLEIAVLVGPALLIFLGFVIFPVVMAGYYGFFRWKGYGPPTDFIGLQNYVTIFQDPTFQEALWHNLVIVVMSLVLQGPVALLLALLLNRPMRGQSLYYASLAPHEYLEILSGEACRCLLYEQDELPEQHAIVIACREPAPSTRARQRVGPSRP